MDPLATIRASVHAAYNAVLAVQPSRIAVYSATDLSPTCEFFVNGLHIRSAAPFRTTSDPTPREAYGPPTPTVDSVLYASTQHDMGVVLHAARHRHALGTFIYVGATVKRVGSVADGMAVCATDYSVALVDTAQRQCVASLTTCYNPHGCMATSHARKLVACPSERGGSVTVYATDTGSERHFAAHQHALRVLRFSACGRFLATCSERGTLVRVFDVDQCFRCVAEYRRGYDPCEVVDVQFHPEHPNVLYVVGDHGEGSTQTVHVFAPAADAPASWWWGGWWPAADDEPSDTRLYMPAPSDERALCVFWYRHHDRVCVLANRAGHFYLFDAAAPEAPPTSGVLV